MTLVDPFEKFLGQINASTPDNSSSFTRDGSSVENTLSELPSINSDPLAPPTSNPPALSRFRKRSKVTQKRNRSPGEVTNSNNKPKNKRDHLSISFPHSEGEISRRLQTRKNKQHRIEASSLDASINTVNEMRNGIDVINMSQSKSHDKDNSGKNDDTLRNISQISISSSPKITTEVVETPKLLLVRPFSPVKVSEKLTTENLSLPHMYVPQAPSQTSSDYLPVINLSELELTDTVSRQPDEAVPLEVSSPHRAAITVTLPTIITEDHQESGNTDSYTSDFLFSSSMSIPGID